MRKVVSAIITILYVTIILGSLGLLVYKTINDISNNTNYLWIKILLQIS